MKTYGLTKDDLAFLRKKMEMQRDYLENSFFSTDSGQVKSLMDVSFSANHSVRYYAQLANKINTMTDYAKSIGQIGIFTTMTLDGWFRDLLQGDYSRFDKFSDEKKELFLKRVPNNDVYGFIRDRIANKEPLSIKELYNVLNYQNKLFLASYVFKKMKKAGIKYSYIRTVEPHQDGVPHFHSMIFIPEEYKELLKSAFISAFPAPQNSKEIDDEGQLTGFQWNIKNASAYIMKYITKSFMDVKNQKELDYLQAWYIKHRINRSVTSHSVIPQWVYQKIMPLEKDWFHLTDLLRSDMGVCEWSKEDDFISILDITNNRHLEYDSGVFRISYDDKIIKEFGTGIERKDFQKEYEQVPSTWKQKHNETQDYIDVYIDDVHFYLKGDLLIEDRKYPHEMDDISLYHYYQSLDINTVNIDHYAETARQMIDRGLMGGTPFTGSDIRELF